MRRVASVLFLSGILLQGCGGGGGGGSGGGNQGGQQPTSFSLAASVSGLEGSVTLTANSNPAVTISSNAQATLARLPAGTPYTVAITAQPTTHYCELASSSGTLNADTTIAVTCVPRIAARKSAVGAFEVAHFDLTELDLEPGEYEGSIDGTIDVKLAAIDGALALLMPPLSDGAHRLEVSIEGVAYPVAFDVSTPALPAAPAQMAADYVREIEDTFAALKADPALTGLSNWTELEAALAQLKDDIATMSAADLEALVRIVWANEPAMLAAAQAKFPLSSFKPGDPVCIDIHRRVVEHFLESSAYVSSTAAIIAIGVELGPYGALAGAAGGMTLYALKAWPAMKKLWSAIGEYRGQQCFTFIRLNIELKLEEAFRSKPALGSSSKAVSAAQEMLTFNHKRTREYTVTGSGELPAEIRGSASLASSVLKFLSSFLSDDAKELLQDWTATYTRPVDLSDFALSDISDSRIAGTLSIGAGTLRLRFEYLPDQMPEEPVEFTFRLSGNNQSWQIPALLNLISAPIAYEDDIETPTDEAYRGELKADFAESFRIALAPVNGRIVLDTTSGQYEYTPNTDYSGDDSFTFVAINDRGESDPAMVRIKVAGLCEVVDMGSRIDRTCYTDASKEGIASTEFVSGGTLVQRFTYEELVPGDVSSTRTAEEYEFRLTDGALTEVLLAKRPYSTAAQSESARVVYSDGAPSTISRWETRRNLDSMTFRTESIFCENGLYTWRISTGEIDSVTGVQYDDTYLRNDVNVPGACPITADEALSILPLELKDIRVWQLWNASPR